MKINYKSNICLLLAALIWGLAFVAQDLVADKLDFFTTNSLRCLIAFISLMPLVIYRAKKDNVPVLENTRERRRDLLKAGILCGLCLVFALNFQQLGISSYPNDVASSGRTGFITGLYVVLVPIVNFVFLKKKININVLISVFIAMVGLYFLCFGEGFKTLEIGDFVNLLSALCFAIQIIIVDKFIGKVDGIKLSAMQLLVCGVINLLLAIIFEQPNIQDIAIVILPVLYLGVFSSGVAYTLQIIGQQLSNNPTVDSIIMSLESVFAILSGIIILGEKISFKEGIGCLLMFIAIVISQLPILKKEKKNV